MHDPGEAPDSFWSSDMSDLEMPLREATRLEATFFGLICATEDKNEGTRAFLEKRKPKFQGK